MKAVCLLVAMAGLGSAAGVQAAASCKMGRVAELPVTMSGLRPLVKAKINGKDATFIADSGAWYSLISPSSAAEYGLRLQSLGPNFMMSGVGGDFRPMMTVVDTFTIAGVSVPKLQFVVGGSDFGSIGLLGQNILALVDTEFDLGRGMIRLMQAEGCSKTNLAYWRQPDEAYSVLDTEGMAQARPHIIASIYVNGVRMSALFDTGAGTSFLSLRAAARIGLKPGQPNVTPSGLTGGLGRKMVSTWIGPVSSIKMGDEEIKNTRLRFGGDDFGTVDMLIGADFFLSHHIYWSNKNRKLFFTYNGGAVFNLRYLMDEEDGAPAPTTATSATTAVSKSVPAGAIGPTPTDAGGFGRRGGARASRGDIAGGLADLDQAVKMAPDDVDLLWQRAELNGQARQPAKVIDDLNQILKINPDHLDALLMRASVRLAMDKGSDIRPDVDAAAKAAPIASIRRLQIAGLYDQLGEYGPAIEQLDLWIAKHPDDNKKWMALNSRCWDRAMAGKDLDRALADCNAALRIAPHNPAFLDSRGMARVRMGDYAKAIIDYDEALKLVPDIAWSHYGRGIARLRLGQKAAGEADLAKAHEIDPKLREKATRLGIVP
ncbi:MAG TPA: aspartyl protease family protein [Sphingomonas sp.]|nr:aspartyl protease family protein [Sphingomonas sp.]